MPAAFLNLFDVCQTHSIVMVAYHRLTIDEISTINVNYSCDLWYHSCGKGDHRCSGDHEGKLHRPKLRS